MVVSHYMTYRDDSWWACGTLRMALSGREIRLTVTPDDLNINGWKLGGEMPTTLVQNTVSFSFTLCRVCKRE